MVFSLDKSQLVAQTLFTCLEYGQQFGIEGEPINNLFCSQFLQIVRSEPSDEHEEFQKTLHSKVIASIFNSMIFFKYFVVEVQQENSAARRLNRMEIGGIHF